MDEVLLKECIEITKELSKDDNAWPFMEPVDPVAQDCPTYFDIIQKPMDIGTIRTKLDKGEYESFEAFVDDMKLVFSNCLLFNKGIKARGIRKMATTLRTKFEKLLSGVIKRNKELFEDNESINSCWLQCDICLKWRLVNIEGSVPYRYRCGDFNSECTCSTPEDPHPVDPSQSDSTSTLGIIYGVYQQDNRYNMKLTDDQINRIHEQIVAENFNNFYYTMWGCSSISSSAFQTFEDLNLDPYTFYTIVVYHQKNWKAVYEELVNLQSQLKSQLEPRIIQRLYTVHVEPYEGKWRSITQEPFPTFYQLYHSLDKQVDCRVCSKCKQAITSHTSAVDCAFCGSQCCTSCYKGRESYICETCQQMTIASWNQFPSCIICGLDIPEPDVPNSYLCCNQCHGLAHFSCNTDIIEDNGDYSTWVCRSCQRTHFSKNVVSTCIIDPNTRYLKPCVRLFQ